MFLGTFFSGGVCLSSIGLSGVPGLGWPFLSNFREVFNYNLLKCFLIPFLFVFFFWDLYNLNTGAHNVLLEVSEIVPISFHTFTLFSASFISTILSSNLLIHSSSLVILLLVPYSEFLVSVIRLFIVNYLFSISSQYLFVSCILLICDFILFIYASILFLRFWITFTIIILYFLSGRLLICLVLFLIVLALFFVWSGEFLACSFIWCMFLCLFILFNLFNVFLIFLHAARL